MLPEWLAEVVALPEVVWLPPELVAVALALPLPDALPVGMSLRVTPYKTNDDD